MIAIGVILLWMSYGLGLWGVSLLKGWNLGFKQIWSPTAFYSGKWPPPLAGNTVIIPDGSASSSQSAGFGTSGGSSGGGSTSTSGTVSGGTAPGGVTGSGAVSAAAAKFGWQSGNAWNCLQTLLRFESGGNPNAYNAGATCGGGYHAYGAFQSCSHGGCGGSSCGHDEYCGYGLSVAQTKLANCGNLYYQAIWGMNYIKATYGSPCNIPGITSGSYGGY